MNAGMKILQETGWYGQEEEDRQWDSGGGGGGGDYYYSSYYGRDRYENKINRSRTKRSASNKELTRGYSESMDEDVYYSTQQSYEDENYQVRNDYTGTTARRKQFNQSRSQSMSQQINDDYDPDFPPRPKSNKPKLLPQIPIKIKPSPSLPPTPVKTQQHQAAKRTGSLEYQEPQEEPNYYQETRNKQNVYNEDYNYAYQSTDNLIPTQPEIIVPANEYRGTVNDMRNSGRGNVQQQAYQEQPYQEQPYQEQPYQEQTYQDQTYQDQTYQDQTYQDQTYQDQAYQDQTYQDQTYQEQTYQDQTQQYYYDDKPPTVQIQKADDEQSLSRRDTIKKQFQGVRRLESPRLFQQNTDSLESKDDDLRDSFETAMSSVSAQGRQSFNSEFTPVPEPITTDKMDRYNNVPVQDKGFSNSTTVDNKNDRYNNMSTHERDRLSSVNQESSERYNSFSATEKNDRYNSSAVPEKNDRFGSNSHIPEKVDRDRYNSGQDRYISVVPEKNDRYGSNSHIPEKVERDRYSTGPGVVGPAIPERNSSRNNSLQLREPVLSQKTSPVATPTSAYPSQNHNQRYLQRQQESIESYVEEEMINEADYSRESPASVVDRYPQETNSLIEPYRPTTPKPSSPSPPKRQETLDEEYDAEYNQSFDQPPEEFPIDELPPSDDQKLLFDEQEIVAIVGDQPKRVRTAKERWHWAYNKIIHQLTIPLAPIAD
ncbi:hypothetical protein J6590_030701 [Homalodisca vitripennis]|nr:hypothetical protein J6590_030701 [Homalodisca vitripennis]